jgi:hypothetical protein
MVAAFLIFQISITSAFIHSQEKLNINIDFKQTISLSEIEKN